jgi:SAM-dependent methyltransferase
MNSVVLANAAEFKEFYERRYQDEYMAEWPVWKRDRVRKMILSLGLPKRGIALDFGCGRGVFTQLIRNALPEWDVVGCDISELAIERARDSFPSCRFFVIGRERLSRCDFLLTHHVLEHVLSLDEAFGQMLGASSEPPTVMLHILPCGNTGSFEHELATLKVNGIEVAHGNRFFFEDEGHVRRLTTSDMERELLARGYRIAEARYANQYDGAVEWITTYDSSFIRAIADPSHAVSPVAAHKLAMLQRRLMLIGRLRRWSSKTYFDAFREVALSIAKLLLLPVAKLVDRRCQGRRRVEWEMRSKEASGSEMYMVAKRDNQSVSAPG